MRGVIRKLGAAVAIWALLVGLPSWGPARAWLAAPLDVGVSEARGDVAYVLGAGRLSIGERLRAAADLYVEHRVARVVLPADPTPSRFSPREGRNLTADAWSRAELVWHGVDAGDIATVAVPDALLDTAAEADALRGALRPEERRVVVVSAPVHLRRAALAFRRALGEGIAVVPFASSALPDGPDFWRPLWLEYVKLGVYALVL